MGDGFKLCLLIKPFLPYIFTNKLRAFYILQIQEKTNQIMYETNQPLLINKLRTYYGLINYTRNVIIQKL